MSCSGGIIATTISHYGHPANERNFNSAAARSPSVSQVHFCRIPLKSMDPLYYCTPRFVLSDISNNLP